MTESHRHSQVNPGLSNNTFKEKHSLGNQGFRQTCAARLLCLLLGTLNAFVAISKQGAHTCYTVQSGRGRGDGRTSGKSLKSPLQCLNDPQYLPILLPPPPTTAPRDQPNHHRVNNTNRACSLDGIYTPGPLKYLWHEMNSFPLGTYHLSIITMF